MMQKKPRALAENAAIVFRGVKELQRHAPAQRHCLGEVNRPCAFAECSMIDMEMFRIISGLQTNERENREKKRKSWGIRIPGGSQ